MKIEQFNEWVEFIKTISRIEMFELIANTDKKYRDVVICAFLVSYEIIIEYEPYESLISMSSTLTTPLVLPFYKDRLKRSLELYELKYKEAFGEYNAKNKK